MPRKMDFETKYNARDAQPFEQKNEMFKRVRWEPELREAGRSYYGIVTPQDRPGFRHEEIAFRNAGWALEMGFARGVIEKNFGLYSWEDNTQGVNELPEGLKFDSGDPEYNTRLVKRAAKLYGADMVGVSKWDRRWIYTKGFHLVTRSEYDIHIPEEYAYVISMAVAMDYEYYKYTPTFIAGADTGLGYSKMAFTAGLLAKFLRQLGYKAIPTGNDTAMSVPYAIQAGLGELGRNNILITPKFGPRVRLCKIFTDFPLVCDEPIEFGVTEFCEACKKCAKHCPPQAIPHGARTVEPLNKSNAGGTLKWYSDLEKCFKFWAKNACDCGNCIRVCPFNKPEGSLHDVTRWFIERFPKLDASLVKADDIFGYGKQADIAAFWHKRD
ncbi:MAG: reductive dehalogenase [Deltaproteobacteria bacterium]|nr:MAG: reductive dehalogenase [Deltaproteobacteria bacterium]